MIRLEMMLHAVHLVYLISMGWKHLTLCSAKVCRPFVLHEEQPIIIFELLKKTLLKVLFHCDSIVTTFIVL